VGRITCQHGKWGIHQTHSVHSVLMFVARSPQRGHAVRGTLWANRQGKRGGMVWGVHDVRSVHAESSPQSLERRPCIRSTLGPAAARASWPAPSETCPPERCWASPKSSATISILLRTWWPPRLVRSRHRRSSLLRVYGRVSQKEKKKSRRDPSTLPCPARPTRAVEW